MKVVESLGDSGLFIKGVTQTMRNKTTEKRGRFFGTLFGILDSILLGNMLACKEVTPTSKRRGFFELMMDLPGLVM